MNTQLQHGALCPFDAYPFTPRAQISAMMTNSKRITEERRVIVELRFPTVEAEIKEMGKECQLEDINFNLTGIFRCS